MNVLEDYECDGQMELSKDVLVWIKEPGYVIYPKRVPNTLEALQEIVGGYVEELGMCTDLRILCNEEAILGDYIFNVSIAGAQLFGNLIIVKIDEEGEIVDFDQEDTIRRLIPQLFEGKTKAAEGEA